MPVATAKLSNLPVAPRKVRLVAAMIRGKRVADAMDILQFTVKRCAEPMRKLLASAAANAEHAAREQRQRINTDDMIVRSVRVNDGRTMYRYLPMPRGRAGRVRHRSSHIEIVISD
ncbi:MAG TPA: 50S ribosomal protein L22 [Candidatus Hydrogenedentes bacterium]|nr:50S ribosomal protein L22 [Candidatus Hydrogenedentota bacterium]HOJ68065.1 50S ribosomal protein L22 [Candidatus Hydrogenedentota bacterium]HOK88829.1 50S ribosomal protein L22 [Candidatus Hydrogenedentota bacterium]HPO31184.1 50S ribosomal protein L22 [Candidatus Hydrogenedentota bacterium]